MDKKIMSLGALLLCALGAGAKVTLPPMFTSNMVIQQKTSAPVWGKATPRTTVTVTPSWNNKTMVTCADHNGDWSLNLKTPKAGGPYTITISDGTAVQLDNVMVGEVWLCTGQSNMEMPLDGWGKIDNFEQEIANANHPRIRLLNIKKSISPRPLDNVEAEGGGWQVCSPQTIPEFSACAYFFGRDLEKYRGVAIGLIEDCWGGSYAENWTSGEALSDLPYFCNQVKEVADLPSSADEQAKLFSKNDKAWWQSIEDADHGMKDNQALWAQPDADLREWKEIKVPGYIQENGLPGVNGIVWLRTEVTIPDSWTDKELTLNLGPVDDNDITFFNGKEIGRTDGWMAPRSYKIPASMVKGGKATITVRVTDTGASGGMYGSADGVNLTGHDGAQIKLAGQWLCRVAADFRDFPAKPVNYANNPFVPTVLYNAMLHPVIPYAIKGAIWYQGESNANMAFQYRDLLPLMIKDWRNRWGYPFDFYIVQLANFMKKQTEPCESTWAELREAQQHTLRLENTGLATAIDIGMEGDIHPKNKQEVGRRLALAARAQTYGEKIDYSGPQYTGCRIEGSKMRLTFSHTAKGLKTSDGAAPKGFTIAGADHKFRWAKATIDGNTIVVEADGVRNPIAVRYAWADNPICNMYNTADLPMLPFRTDDWKLTTER